MDCLFYLIVVFIQLSTSFRKTNAMQECSEPESMPIITFNEFVNITVRQSFSIIPGTSGTTSTESGIPLQYKNIRYRHFFGQRQCKNVKKGRRSKINNTLNNLSQCMWRYIENIDLNRKPNTLLEVECVCSTPVNSRKNVDMICERVFEYVSVYRRTGCNNGVFEYKRVWEPRAVACVATTLPRSTQLKTIEYKMSEQR